MELSLFDLYQPDTIRSPLVVSVPHSGLVVPEERHELMRLPRATFLRDVDYEIQQMWQSPCRDLGVPFIRTVVHRYAIDLNRRLDQVDASMIQGHPRPVDSEKSGLFWTHSTQQESLAPGEDSFRALEPKVAKALIEIVWRPYYQWIQQALLAAKAQFGFAILVDGHSMPSRGSAFHSDPAAHRADIVPGNLHGKSCHPLITQKSIEIAQQLKYSVLPNQPYSGGGITQHFAKLAPDIHALQIEVNRKLYMDEQSKELNRDGMEKLTQYASTLLQHLAVFSAAELRPSSASV